MDDYVGRRGDELVAQEDEAADLEVLRLEGDRIGLRSVRREVRTQETMR